MERRIRNREERWVVLACFLVAVINTIIQASLWRKSICLPFTTLSQFIIKRIWGGIWRQELKQRWWMKAVYGLAVIQLHNLARDSTAHTGQDLSTSMINKVNISQICWQTNLMETISQLNFLFLADYVWVKHPHNRGGDIDLRFSLNMHFKH